MKTILFTVAIIATAFTQNSFAQDNTNKSQLPQLLSLYFNIKDALVAGNATEAASTAEAFDKVSSGISVKGVNETNIKGLARHARMISGSKDLKKQREHFAELSNEMIAVAKTAKLGDKPVYQQYCPMKKASWLSDQKAIKNPYYGSSMLTCGEVTATFQ
jgi:hypothetical protein